jgi:hypothetical protein
MFAIQLSLGVVKTAVLFVCAYYIDHAFGRRKLLFFSAVGIVVSHLTIAFGSWAAMAWVEVVGFYLFGIAFSIGVGPIGWLFVAEVLPLWARAKGKLVYLLWT